MVLVIAHVWAFWWPWGGCVRVIQQCSSPVASSSLPPNLPVGFYSEYASGVYPHFSTPQITALRTSSGPIYSNLALLFHASIYYFLSLSLPRLHFGRSKLLILLFFSPLLLFLLFYSGSSAAVFGR